MGKRLILGRVLRFEASPFVQEPETSATLINGGGVLIEGGLISEVGDGAALRRKHPDADVDDTGGSLISAGFVDAHAHYPQTAMIASWGKRLIDWLESYTFPEEMRFDASEYARDIAERWLDLITANGTTSAATYCTSHPQSVDAVFEAARARGMRLFAGKTCMDRNAPKALCDTAQRAYDESRDLLLRWHGEGRLSYVITPRFSPTSTPEQLDALGTLWAEHPECLMQTHLSEQTDEIAWVRALFPNARDYLDTYESHGLLGGRGLYGHAIHLEPRERDRLHEFGAGLVHCPTSNTFIGSGLFDMGGLKSAGHHVGLATDTGGGSSFSMLRTMAATYEIGQLSGRALHPAELWWLATAGSAEVLHVGDKIGNIIPGMEADLIALDLASTPAISQRATRAVSFWEEVFPTIMMGDDRAIRQVWIGGEKV
ncbi:guanine deaminase [Poseidonocella pacifica]|uniref:Guanine deaminase n=1 Tax=Poseidonocella pacifica TaxID=871651 RepID=A0A1I0WBQ2_9RHOB|nr:guanine deaminase [Poseidonocella pacifica]SFA85453.1 guanine deaminase [Poseidonocella pacifica]